MNRTDEYKKLVDLIKKFKKERGLIARNEDIARALGIDRAYFSTLINGGRPVTDKHIKSLRSEFPEVFTKSTPDNSEKLTHSKWGITPEAYIMKLESQNQTLEQAILLSLNAIQERQNLAKDQLETFANRMYQMVRVSLDETAEVRATVQKKDPLVVKAEVDRKLTSGLKVGK